MDLFGNKYLENMFDEYLPSKIDSMMRCDVYEKCGCFYIEMDLPGVKKEEISLEVRDNYLTVKVEKSDANNVDDRNYLRKERVYGSYERSFSIENLDYEKVDASFENGILKITIPKSSNEENKRVIDIK